MIPLDVKKQAVGLVHSAGVESALTHGMEQEPPAVRTDLSSTWGNLSADCRA